MENIRPSGFHDPSLLVTHPGKPQGSTSIVAPQADYMQVDFNTQCFYPHPFQLKPNHWSTSPAAYELDTYFSYDHNIYEAPDTNLLTPTLQQFYPSVSTNCSSASSPSPLAEYQMQLYGASDVAMGYLNYSRQSNLRLNDRWEYPTACFR